MSIPARTASLLRRLLPLSLLAGLALTGCTLVGQGDLHIANDESGIGRDNTVLRAFAPDPGDAWPPAGYVDVFVRGDDFGKPPSYGMNGYLYLVRTDAACPQSEGTPESFTLAQVNIVGIVTVINGSVNQFTAMQDSAANRQARFALIEINELAGFPGEHLIHRCGTVSWAPPGSALVDPCTLRVSLEGQALAPGVSFNLDANRRWQVCNGGAAAGSNEKFLFRTTDGGATWSLISRTTLGNPPAESGVGDMPNGNGASALFFTDANNGWLGLTSPGQNLYRSTNGGRDWTVKTVAGLDPAEPVLSISFSDANHGTFTTPDGSFITSNGGTTWTASP